MKSFKNKHLKRLLTSICLITSLGFISNNSAIASKNSIVVSNNNACSFVKYSDIKNDYVNKKPWLTEFSEESVMAFAKSKNLNIDEQQQLDEKERTLGYRYNRNKIQQIIDRINVINKKANEYDKNVLATLMLNALCGNKISFENGLPDIIYAIQCCQLEAHVSLNGSDCEVLKNENVRSFYKKIDHTRKERGLSYIGGFISDKMLRLLMSDVHCFFDGRQCYLDACRAFLKFINNDVLKRFYSEHPEQCIDIYFTDEENSPTSLLLLSKDIYKEQVSKNNDNETSRCENVMLIVRDRVASIFGENILSKGNKYDVCVHSSIWADYDDYQTKKLVRNRKLIYESTIDAIKNFQNDKNPNIKQYLDDILGMYSSLKNLRITALHTSKGNERIKDAKKLLKKVMDDYFNLKRTKKKNSSKSNDIIPTLSKKEFTKLCECADVGYKRHLKDKDENGNLIEFSDYFKVYGDRTADYFLSELKNFQVKIGLEDDKSVKSDKVKDNKPVGADLFIKQMLEYCNRIQDVQNVEKLKLRPVEDTLKKLKILFNFNSMTEKQFFDAERENVENYVFKEYIDYRLKQLSPVSELSLTEQKEELKGLFQKEGTDQQKVNKENWQLIQKLRRFDTIIKVVGKKGFWGDTVGGIKEHLETDLKAPYLYELLVEKHRITSESLEKAEELLAALNNEGTREKIATLLADIKRFIVPLDNQLTQTVSLFDENRTELYDIKTDRGSLKVYVEDPNRVDEGDLVADVDMRDCLLKYVSNPHFFVHSYKRWIDHNKLSNMSKLSFKGEIKDEEKVINLYWREEQKEY